ncbi:hypothetical protein D3C81_1923470 [compost metagenome]
MQQREDPLRANAHRLGKVAEMNPLVCPSDHVGELHLGGIFSQLLLKYHILLGQLSCQPQRIGQVLRDLGAPLLQLLPAANDPHPQVSVVARN